MTMETKIRTGDTAVIFYGDDGVLPGEIVKIIKSRTGNIRRVGITPEGTDIVAWFAPVPDMHGLVSVGGSTVAYW